MLFQTLNKLILAFSLSLITSFSLFAAAPGADLAIGKSASVSMVNQSEAMSYTLEVKNLTSNKNAVDVSITDSLPNGVTYVSSTASTTGSGSAAFTCSTAGSSPVVVSCVSTLLEKAESATIILNVTANDSNVSGTVVLNNTASVTNTTNDADLTNNTSNTVSVTLNRPPTAVNDSASTPSHTVVTGNILTNDSDLDGDTFSLDTTGSFTTTYGSIVIASNGSYTYTPGYFSGVTDSYTYTVTDTNGASSRAVLSINIDSACTDTGLNRTTRDFCLRKQTTLFGDMVTIGNALVVAPSPQSVSGTNYQTYCNSYSEGSFIANELVDPNEDLYICSYKTDTYINETSAELITTAGSTIKWAGLYLQSVVKRSDSSSLLSMDVKIKNGSSGYKSAGTPTVVNYYNYESTNGENYDNYSAFIDVTSVLTSNNWGNGLYTVANVPVTTDTLANASVGKYGAWSLVVIYEDISLPLKSTSVYDGWKRITGSAQTITVDNFYTPTTGAIDSEVSIFVAEGDKNLAGDRFRVGTTNLETETGNAFNSSINTSGTRTPMVTNNQGIDIKTYQVGTSGYNLLSGGDSNITFSLSTGSPGNDWYYPAMLSFSTEVYSPKMCYTENLYDSSGTQLTAGALVTKGSTITAKVLLKNDENEPAEKVSLYRTFDSTMPYEVNSTAINNSPTSTMLSSTTSVTDTLDTDEFEYTVAKVFSLNLGTGATFNQGGDFNTNETAVFNYNTIANFEGNTSIVYQIAYTMPTVGFKYEGELAKCVDFNSTFGVIPSTPNPNAAMDVIEASSYTTDYASANKNIFTKVVAKPFNLELVYLDSSGNEAPYNVSVGTRTYNMAVMIYTSDTATCTQDNELVWSGEFVNGTSHMTIGANVLSQAVKDQTMRISYIDYGTLMNEANILNCAASSLDSSLCLVPACYNSDAKILAAFPPADYPYVTTCINGDGGGAAPCDSSAYTGSCGGKITTISPSKYNHDTGCAACLSDALNLNSCSSDNFSARPDRLSVTSTNAHLPDLMRSAQEYNTIVNAYNYGTSVNTPSYTFTNANTVFDMNDTKYNKNNVVDANMVGTASFGSTSFNMLNGLSNVSGASEVVGLKFDDVGKVIIHIEDRVWAAVDADDTNATCDGRYVCGDLNATFIPDHFDFSGTTLTDNNATIGSFTYISNKRNEMAARVDTTIRALNKDNNVTLNFAPSPLYENPVTVIQVATTPTYMYPDANETNITNATIGFGAGQRAIAWSDSNTTTQLRFNFRRDLNMSVNPFVVTGTDYNVSISSDYTATAGTATITGDLNTTATGSATFVYGRTNGPLKIFRGATGNSLIYYESFCFSTDDSGIVCNKALLPDGAASAMTNDPRWFINTQHTATEGQLGTIAQKNPLGGTALVTLNGVTSTAAGITTVPLIYDTTAGYPYKTTMDHNASSWLIYHKYDTTLSKTKNEFNVEFIGINATWAGQHETNTTTDTNASTRTNRRSMW